MSNTLVWHIVRDHNSFFRKQASNGAKFSAEAGNLYNRHSFKHSALANPKFLDIQAKDGAVKVVRGSEKNANKPRKVAASAYIVKSNARRAIAAVGKQTGSFRKDLQKAAVGRMSAIQKSLRVQRTTKTA
eukprot:CAMPEP_0119102430 /NCGR_PEP_ID=MMETSP1180-20130426/1180_1 /TAXON_ID=3052 ORGANISM="Chlamydomonas cf sp, Strain CCMP681" /NCGR_SAMPLE_ID=MMETSP1180 /ASSEMBLY_ACC=CAM_ASM_000741 /LENGTH=129 /DNA_ID=CAMNT_0007086723 /DNA_START=83 /DNA_END=472 /DNA_ORIENTATION=-